MQIILIKEVESLGDKNAVINVSDGYARNFLFPKKLAILADKSSLNELSKKVKREEAKLEKRKDEFKQIADKLHNLKVEIKADVGEENKLFGSITSQDIVEAVKELINIDLDKRQILLNEHIKVAGNKDVEVKFTSDIKATLSLLISPK